MIEASADIRSLAPYVPGKPIQTLERELGIQGAIKMASNENPLGPSKLAIEAMRQNLKVVQRYPDGGGFSLIEALADKWNLPSSQVILGNGSNEIIELLVRTFILPGDEAIMACPSFSLYRLMIQSGHGRVIQVPLKNGVHDLSAMAKEIRPATRLIFICNPNNPTGTIIKQKELVTFVAQLPSTALLVVDEAYGEYVTDTGYPLVVELVRAGKAVMALRTFSKIYGLAGLRLGYALAPSSVVDVMDRLRQPFNTNTLAQVAAMAALSDTVHVKKSLEVNEKGKVYLYRQFEKLGLSYLPTEANFIYFSAFQSTGEIEAELEIEKKRGAALQMALLKQGVIIRHFGSHRFRVSIGRPRENQRFIRSLKKALHALD